MPATYFLDLKGGRLWARMFRSITEVIWNPGETGARGEVAPRPRPGEVLVFHEQEGPIGAEVRELAAQGVLVIAVSLGGGDGAEITDGYYRRRRGVDKPTDAHFEACFSRFIEHLEQTGAPDWRLLEGPPAPDALLAYHLLAILTGDPEADRELKAVRAKAVGQAEAIATIMGLDPAKHLGDIDKPEKRREFLRECR